MDPTSIIGTKNKKGQIITDPREMMHQAPRTPSFFTGSEVIKEAVRRANVDIMVAYPITPQSEAAALCGELFAEGYIGDYFRGESEFAVMSQCAGAAFGGARVFTTTAGPGTLRAMENFPMWAGARLPIQCIVTCRGINSPLSIQPDTIEIAYLMNTGMLVWHAETAQDFYDWILKGYMVSEEPDVHLPLALCCDGFFVTHTKDVVDLTPADMCLPPYDPYRSPVPCMDMECPPVRMMRDPFVMKSNYISYATHASWQQEVWAAAERSRKHTIAWLNGLIDIEDGDAESSPIWGCLLLRFHSRQPRPVSTRCQCYRALWLSMICRSWITSCQRYRWRSQRRVLAMSTASKTLHMSVCFTVGRS